MKQLSFSSNWNGKLYCDAFTSIRLSNYYDIDDIVFINLNNECIDTAQVIGKIETKIEKLTELVCRLDTGYSREQTIYIIKKMYQGITDWDNTKIYIYTLLRTYSGKENNASDFYLKKALGDAYNPELMTEEKLFMIRELLSDKLLLSPPPVNCQDK